MVTCYSVWTCRNGRQLRLPQMSTDHIINCIHKIHAYNWRLSWLPVFKEEMFERTQEGKAAAREHASNILQTLIAYGA